MPQDNDSQDDQPADWTDQWNDSGRWAGRHEIRLCYVAVDYWLRLSGNRSISALPGQSEFRNRPQTGWMAGK